MATVLATCANTNTPLCTIHVS